MSIKMKYYILLSILLLLDVGSIFIHLNYSVVNQTFIGLLIFIVLAINITLVYNTIKADIVVTHNKTNIFIILFFVFSCITILPYEIKIRAISFNYYDCLPMILPYLSAATVLSYFIANTYKKGYFTSPKPGIIILDLVLLICIVFLFIKSILLCFGIYLDKNFIFLYANLT